MYEEKLIKLMLEYPEIAELIKKQQEEIKELRIRVKFWERFYNETIRLYGKKKGRLGDMLSRSMSCLKLECEIHAINDDEITERKETKSLGGFKVREFKEDCDEQKQKEFGCRRSKSVVLEYLTLTNAEPNLLEPDFKPLNKNVAIKELAKKYKFASSEACYKYLQRQGVKGLPSTWPLTSKGQK